MATYTAEQLEGDYPVPGAAPSAAAPLPPAAPGNAAPAAAPLPPTARRTYTAEQLDADYPAPGNAAPAAAPQAAAPNPVFAALDPFAGSAGGDFTGAVVRGMPIVGQVPEDLAGAIKASTDYAWDRLPSVTPTAFSQQKGGPQSWGDYYRQDVGRLRAPGEQWATEHPYQAGAANAIGTAAGSVPLGVAAKAAGLIPASSRLITQLALGGLYGGAGGAAQAALDPNATLPSIGAGAATGAMAGTGTVVPGGVPTAAAASGLTLKELAELPVKIGSPLAGGHILGLPWWLGAAGAVPGAIEAMKDLAKTAIQKVPAWWLQAAPGLGAKAGGVGATSEQKATADGT